MKSDLHMSARQAEGSVVIVGNRLFNRNWKLHDDEDTIDLDTLPASYSIRQAGKSIEVMALAAVVDEIMNSDASTVVTYHDDGSKKQGTGSFSVQGLTINGKFRALPAMQIASES